MILVTSCPECKTTFRISVGILEKAGGQVRCGRCARIFDANAKLREVDESEVESKPSPAFKFELQPDPELDSPAEPSADAPPAVSRDATEESGGEPGERDDTSPDDEISAPDAELAAPDDGIAAPDNQLSAPDDELSASDDELSAPDDDIPASDDEHAEPVGEPTDAKLAAAESRELATEAEAVLPDRDDASSASDDELAMSDAEVEAEAEAEAKTEAEADAAVEAEAKAEADADTEAAPEAEHEHIVLETSPATRQPRSADEPSVAAERSEVPAWLLAQSEPRPARTRLWAAGVALATLALVGQLVHQYREELIAVPAIGPMLSLAYAGFGTELRPRVDLDQYELRDLTAVAEPSGEDQGWLVIETRVHNSGPDVQPYPHIFVRLLDRWEDTVAARYFAPDEYAVSSIADIDRMSVGNTIDAQFIIMDPGPSATGFELELCIELTRGFQCESDVDDE